jgi:Temperature dependent protein affecting M2 dsRNA replication
MKTLVSNILVLLCMALVYPDIESNLIVDEDKRHVRYICRLACTTSVKTSPTVWRAPVSHAYLAFNSMVMEFSRNMRNLVEMVVLAMCVHGDVDRIGRDTFEWTKLGLMYFP